MRKLTRKRQKNWRPRRCDMRTAARDIARAFVSATRDTSTANQVAQSLQPIARAMTTDASLRIFFDNQSITPARKEKALHDACGAALTHEAQQLVRILLAHHAMHELGDVLSAVQEECDRRLHRARVMVASAVQISADVRLRIERALARALDRTVQAEYVVQPSHIGGFAVTIDGSRAWDGTVRGRLDRLRAKLASV